jgi:hypothetical protein
LRVERRQRRVGQHARDAAELRADRLDRKAKNGRRQRRGGHRDQQARPRGPPALHAQDDAYGQRGDRDGRRVGRSGRLAERDKPGQEVARLLARQRQAEQVVQLAGQDDDGDAGGEADRHRIGDEFHIGAEPEVTGRDQEDAGHQHRQDQPVDAVAVDGGGHDHDEGAGRAADLEAAAAERRHQEPADDGCVQSTLGANARCNGDGHRQRQRHDGDGQAGDHIGSQLPEVVALAQHRDQLGREQLGKARPRLMVD